MPKTHPAQEKETKARLEFIARRRQRRLLDLIGKLEWDETYDYKAERSRG
jgi:hypothetical protein